MVHHDVGQKDVAGRSLQPPRDHGKTKQVGRPRSHRHHHHHTHPRPQSPPATSPPATTGPGSNPGRGGKAATAAVEKRVAEGGPRPGPQQRGQPLTQQGRRGGGRLASSEWQRASSREPTVTTASYTQPTEHIRATCGLGMHFFLALDVVVFGLQLALNVIFLYVPVLTHGDKVEIFYRAVIYAAMSAHYFYLLTVVVADSAYHCQPRPPLYILSVCLYSPVAVQFACVIALSLSFLMSGAAKSSEAFLSMVGVVVAFIVTILAFLYCCYRVSYMNEIHGRKFGEKIKFRERRWKDPNLTTNSSVPTEH